MVLCDAMGPVETMGAGGWSRAVEIMSASGWLRAAVCATLLTLGLVNATKICFFLVNWLIYLVFAKLSIHHRNIQDPQLQKDLQVIICGLPRSGTLSMMQAMEILGFPCFHGVHLFKPTTHNLFEKALDSGKVEDWKVLLNGYASIADLPGAYAYKKLMDMYPNAKVILTIRDPDEWYTSFSQTILYGMDKCRHLPFSIYPVNMYRTTVRILYNIILRGKPHDRETCIESYNQHIRDVKACVDPRKLLIYEVGKHDGWTLLCDFLNVAKPSVPFPSSNDRKAFQSFVKRAFRITTIVAVSYFIVVVLITSFLLT